MFDRFTESAIRVIMDAQFEATRLDQPHVDSEHLLLGLIAGRQGKATSALRAVGLSLPVVRAQLETLTGKGFGTTSEPPPFSDTSKKILEQSWNEARKLNDNHIGTEHLLLALLHTPHTLALKVLLNANVSLKELEEKLQLDAPLQQG